MRTQFTALLLVGLIAACDARVSLAQVGHSAAAPMQVWNRTSQGMSTNAALAFYRVQNIGRPAMTTPMLPSYTRVPVTTSYAAPGVPNTYYPLSASTQVQKPFANVRPPTTAYDRYWPYLMEGYEDPETGYIIWTLP